MDSNVSLQFAIPGASWKLQFSKEAVTFINSHRQKSWFQRETVGQLFSPDLTGSVISISEATVLTRVKGSRTSVTFDPNEVANERDTKFGQGLYCVGIWHTHPEPVPTPSRTDERLAGDHALAAKSVLNGLCFVIVGTAPSPGGWYVSIHDGHTFHATRQLFISCGNELPKEGGAVHPE